MVEGEGVRIDSRNRVTCEDGEWSVGERGEEHWLVLGVSAVGRSGEKDKVGLELLRKGRR